MCKWIALGLMVLVVLAVIVIKLLAWWQAALVIFGGMLLLGLLVKLVGPKLIEKAFTAPFKAKGKVLHGATIEVHSAEPCERPERARFDDGDDDDDDDDEEDAEERRRDVQRSYYRLEVTITPAEPTGNFAHWEVGELVLVPFDAKPMAGAGGEDDDDIDDLARIDVVEIEADGEYREDDGDKLPGAQRLRLTVGAMPGQKRLKFRYYFEDFGEVVLP